jgi:hypothetical protein
MGRKDKKDRGLMSSLQLSGILWIVGIVVGFVVVVVVVQSPCRPPVVVFLLSFELEKDRRSGMRTSPPSGLARTAIDFQIANHPVSRWSMSPIDRE